MKPDGVHLVNSCCDPTFSITHLLKALLLPHHHFQNRVKEWDCLDVWVCLSQLAKVIQGPVDTWVDNFSITPSKHRCCGCIFLCRSSSEDLTLQEVLPKTKPHPTPSPSPCTSQMCFRTQNTSQVQCHT